MCIRDSEIAALRGGVPSAMASIPLRYMHTPAAVSYTHLILVELFSDEGIGTMLY